MRKFLTLIALLFFCFQAYQLSGAPKDGSSKLLTSTSSISFKLAGKSYTFSGSQSTMTDSGYGVMAIQIESVSHKDAKALAIVANKKNGEQILVTVPNQEFKVGKVYLDTPRQYQTFTLLLNDIGYFTSKSENEMQFTITKREGNTISGTFGGPIFQSVKSKDQNGQEIQQWKYYILKEGSFYNIVIPTN